MSVLIKGMDMPCMCCLCPCHDWDMETNRYYCQALKDEPRIIDENTRRDDCPLVEIPTPHGRLIDADNVSSDAMCSHCVEEYCRNNCECFIENVQTILSNELITPTIIEAEVSE